MGRTTGYSGYSGISSISGYSGISGYGIFSGFSGFSGCCSGTLFSYDSLPAGTCNIKRPKHINEEVWESMSFLMREYVTRER